MNNAQQQTLRIHNPDLTHDLELTADLTARFIHHGLFNEDMIDDFKCERTRKDQIQKLLMKLPRRGPRAFDMFVFAIQEHYSWLADDLRKTYHKISFKTEPKMMELTQQVDIYVHEHFGNSKRLCEDDKKDIKRFLYSHLKSCRESEEFNSLGRVHRNSESEKENNQSTRSKILSKIYAIFGKNQTDGSDDFDELDGHFVDTVDREADVTIEMIESKVRELESKVRELNDKNDSLQNEINDCFSIIGVKDNGVPLHEVLEQFTEEQDKERQRFAMMQENLDKLERQRQSLKSELQQSKKMFQETINKLADSEHQNEKSEVLLRDLQAKCSKLEQIQIKHAEKEQTLLALKDMVKELNPVQKQRQDPFHFPAPGNSNLPANSSSLLPKLSPVRVNRQGRQQHKSEMRDRSSDHHCEFPQVRASHGVPWK